MESCAIWRENFHVQVSVVFIDISLHFDWLLDCFELSATCHLTRGGIQNTMAFVQAHFYSPHSSRRLASHAD